MRPREARHILAAWARGEPARLPAERAQQSTKEFPCPLTHQQLRRLFEIARHPSRSQPSKLDPFALPPY